MVFNASVPINTPAYTTASYVLVPSSAESGKRTVAHLRLKALSNVDNFTSDSATIPIGYTIQYVPAGYNVQVPAWNATG